MKDLLTKVVVPNSGKKIGYDDKLLLLGSCFADNIGEKFGAHYFQMLSNPYGIATLLKLMEDYKDKLIIIFAGYKEEMEQFLDANSGLISRIRSFATSALALPIVE